MTLSRRSFSAIFAIACASASPVWATSFQAAVIGNGTYDAAPLPNAPRDAATVAEALASVGFEVRTYFNVSKSDMDTVLAEIADQFEDAEIGVVYYAGHGFQFNGANQLLAVDVAELTSAEITAKAVSLGDLLAATQPEGGTPSGALRLFLIDACRDDPFSSIDDSFQRGLALDEAGDVETLIAYSTAAGELAYDGPAGGNGPYALALTKALQSEEPTISSVLRSVRRDVRIATTGLQIPWVVGSIETDPVFGVSVDNETLVPVVEGEVPSLDTIVWSFVSNDLTEDTFLQFALNFPTSRFAEVADQRVREIKANREDAEPTRNVGETAVSGETLAELAEARQLFATTVGFAPDTDIPAELFALWPQTLPETATGLKSIVTQCDLLASDPADMQRIAPPVRSGLVNVREAARACGFALANDPENPRFLFQFGRVLQIAGRHDWARTYYLQASAYDYSAALTNLGFMALEGIGQEENFEAAAEFYRQAAELGNLRARTNVGSLYLKGQGVPELPEEGVLWFRLAAGMGWANAQNALADLYRRGVGVEQDYSASAALYHLAAANGQRAAMNNLGRSYLEGWGVEPSDKAAIQWFERAVQQGDRFAPRNLARHLLGTGASDQDRIVSLFKLAANRGERRAYLDLSELYRKGEILAADPAEAYFYARLAEFGRVKGAEEAVTETRAGISEAEAAEIDAEIRQRRQLNGL